ncbi:hypothetical protein Tco_0604238 [Tanacetum coccineum]
MEMRGQMISSFTLGGRYGGATGIREKWEERSLLQIVWIFLPFLSYPVAPPYLLSCGNEDIIFDPGISIYHSFMPGCPGFLKPLVLTVFVLRSQELHNPQLHLGIPIS